MMYRVRVKVSLKPGHIDPEGEITKDALLELRYPVRSVRVSKIYEILLETGSLDEAKYMAEEMCKRLLANPVKDDYEYTVEEVGT